jgi:DNA processing protein
VASPHDGLRGPTLSGMAAGRDDERVALLALLRARPRGMTWAAITEAVLEADSAIEVWSEFALPSLLADDEPALQEAREIIAAWEGEGAEFVTVLDDRYPPQLREIHEAPPLLFHRGSLRRDDRAVSVVGSRKAGDVGLEIAHSIATHLVSQGLTVVAGLAAGVDAVAHRAALERGGRTVGVLGTGIRQYYPAENRGLQDAIARDGLLLSQFYPDARGSKTSFPMRNATMSGYGIATVIVEAGEYSGARIQARKAVEHGRPVILTDLVLDRNDWAKELSSRPGVFVASSARDVMDVIEAVDGETAALREAAAAVSG